MTTAARCESGIVALVASARSAPYSVHYWSAGDDPEQGAPCDCGERRWKVRDDDE